MKNRLLLMIVLILSLLLAFFCIDYHKETILSILNVDKNSTQTDIDIEDRTPDVEEKSVYVEALVEEENKSLEVEKVETTSSDTNVEKAVKLEEPIEAVKEVTPEKELEAIKEVEVAKSKVEVLEVTKVPETTTVIKTTNGDATNTKKDKEISENSEGYDLSEIEIMMIEELNKRESN